MIGTCRSVTSLNRCGPGISAVCREGKIVAVAVAVDRVEV